MFRGHFIGRIVNLRSILEIYDITCDITFVEDTLGVFHESYIVGYIVDFHDLP